MRRTPVARRARPSDSGSSRKASGVLVGMFLATLVGLTVSAGSALAAPGDDRVLILSTSVSGGELSPEAQAAIALGLGVDIATPEQWAALTAADFGAYRAIILGDPSCGGIGSAPFIGAAEANAMVWGPMVDGDVILVGTDPVLHGRVELTNKGVALAVSEPGKTGAYITLGCYYHGAAPGTPVPALAGLSSFGTFTATGVAGCFDAVHIVAAHPALDGLTDEYLSNWGCAVHEAFDSWPADFVVLAIATTGGAYTATDGTVGTPYILARGDTIAVVSDIGLDGPSAAYIGEPGQLTASVTTGGIPVVGATVTFTATAGPHAGVLGTAVTDGSGVATLSFTGAAVGTDLIVASYVDTAVRTQSSGTLSVTWSVAPDPAPVPDPSLDPAPVPSDGGVSPSAPPSTVPAATDDLESGAGGAAETGPIVAPVSTAPGDSLPNTALQSPGPELLWLAMLIPSLAAVAAGATIRLTVGRHRPKGRAATASTPERFG